MRRDAALCVAALLVAAGCLGHVAPLYPPRPGEPVARVWVVEHGWHAGLVVERALIPAGLWPEQDDLPDARYLEVGWGDADFYRSPDPGLWLALRAAAGSRGSAAHLLALRAPPAPGPGREVAEIRLSRPGFEALARFVHASFERDGRARAPRLGPGLYPASAFYPARGRYHLFNTCNTWIADALRAAGVPITPARAITAGGLLRQLRRLEPPAR